MEFLKKNYEKILLALVLLGLTVAVGFLLFFIPEEQNKLKMHTNVLLNPTNIVALPPPDMKTEDAAMQRTGASVQLDFSTKHNLFNPALWQVLPAGRLRKIEDPSQIGPRALKILAMKPLNFTVTYNNAIPSGFLFTIDKQVSTNRTVTTHEVAPLEGLGRVLTVKKLVGSAESPQEFQLEYRESKDKRESFTVTPDKPFQRVDGYAVDLKYPPDPGIQIAPGLVRGNQFKLEGQQVYSILEIKENSIVVSSQANNQRFTIPITESP